MDLRQLSALVAVADHQTFSAAARALHTVQSNVSTHVAHLERELGVTLVDRAAGRLTPEGEVVVERARRIQVEVEGLFDEVATVGGEVQGPARLGAIGTVARWLVPALLPAVRTEYPGMHLVVLEATTTSLVPQLVAGDLDLAVVALPIDEHDLLFDELFSEELLVVVPAGHPLGEAERLPIEALAGEPLLLGPPGTALRDVLDVAARQAGATLRAQAEIDGMRLIASLALEGYGAAVLPATAVPRRTNGAWRAVALDGPPPRRVGLARRRRGLPSAAARALAALVRAVVAVELPAHEGVRATLATAEP